MKLNWGDPLNRSEQTKWSEIMTSRSLLMMSFVDSVITFLSRRLLFDFRFVLLFLTPAHFYFHPNILPSVQVSQWRRQKLCTGVAQGEHERLTEGHRSGPYADGERGQGGHCFPLLNPRSKFWLKKCVFDSF